MRGQMIAKACAAVLFSFGLAACGGGGSKFSLTASGASSSGSSSSSSSSSGTTSSSGSSSGTTGGSRIPQALTLASAQTSVTADGQSAAVITATITDTTGFPIANETLNFSTSAGSLSSKSAVTGSSGQGVVDLIASTTAGRATVTVREPTSGLSANVNVAFVAGPAATVTMVLAPSTVLPGATTTADASVTDANGNAVTGEPVTFSAITDASGGAFQNLSVASDVNGRATSSYTAGTQSGTDVLQAKTAGGLTSTASLAVNTGATLIGSVKLTLGATSAAADGNTQTAVRAAVLDTNSNPVPNAVVTFAASAGKLSATSATTDSTGTAVVSLTSPTIPGTVTVSAKTAGFSSSAQIAFTAGQVAAISLSASPSQVAIGGSSSLQATATDANGNPIPNLGLSFAISTNASGATLSTTQGTTNANGSAIITYQSGTKVTGTALDTVTATAAGASGTNISNKVSISVSSSNATVGNLALSLGTNTIAAAAGNSVSVTATVTDTSGNPVIGSSVAFSTTGGTLSSSTALTGSNGQAAISITPPTAATSVTITAQISGIVVTQALTVTPGAASASNSSITASPTTVVANGTSTSTITVLLNDAFNNPLPNGTSVTLLTQAGGFVGSNTQTLANGSASFTLQAPSSPAASNTVSVQGITGLSTVVSFVSNTTGDPAEILFKTSTNSITVVGTGQNSLATITVTVVDSSGNPISESSYVNNPINNLRMTFIAHPNGGETLTGKNAAGAVVTSTTSIDVVTSNGVAVINLQSGTISGIVEVTAQVLKFSGTSLNNAADIATSASLPQLSIASGPPNAFVFSHANASITNLGGGSYSRTGEVTVTDTYGNKVSDGTVVNLELMDSVILQDDTGVTVAGAATLTRSGPSLITRRCTGQPPVQAGGATEATGCSLEGAKTDTSNFDSTITRNGTSRGIESGDLILLQNAVLNDKKNFVSAVGSATALTTINDYIATLTGGNFWIGSALLGGQIAGTSSSAAATSGTATTANGIATFQVTYPATVDTILSGCYGYKSDNSYSDNDKRDAVPQSRQVVVTASAGNNASGVDPGEFCFAAVAPPVVTAFAQTVSMEAGGAGDSYDDSLTVTDSGDHLLLPYVPVTCILTTVVNGSGKFSLSITMDTDTDGDPVTGVNGVSGVSFVLNGGVAGDSGTVNCTANFAGAAGSTTITVNAH